MLALVLLLLLFDEPHVFTCTATEPWRVVCEIRPNVFGVYLINGDKDNDWSEWLLFSEHWNLPLVKRKVVKGQVLKATLDKQGRLVAVASCNVRVHRRVNEWAKNHPGERVPFTVMELPADCQPKQ